MTHIKKTRDMKMTAYMLGFTFLSAVFFASYSFASDLKNVDDNIILPSDEVVLDTDSADLSSDVVDTKDNSVSSIHDEQQVLLKRLKSDLSLARADYSHYKGTVTDENEYLIKLQNKEVSLNSQIELLDHNTEVTKERLKKTFLDLKDNETKLVEIYDQINVRKIALAEQKEQLKLYLKLIYKEEDKFLTFKNDSVDALKLLLADGTVSSNMQDVDYVSILTESAYQLIDKLNQLNAELLSYKDAVNVEHNHILLAKESIEKDKAELEMRKIAKNKLLNTTKAQQTVYSKLLENSLSEKADLREKIVNLNSAIAFVEDKISSDGDSFNPKDYDYLFTEKSNSLFKFNQATLGNGVSKMAWPAAPTRGISAYFHDPSYFGIFGVQHQAIDIPMSQGSPLYSPADGVVYKVADNGYGYSYLMIAHAGGMMTVYGHVSDMLVTEGQVVSQGSIIAMSGGMPGTKGAGYMTTGPHLHFEMILNGVHVDPLKYLPLSVLDEDGIATLPERYYDAWLDSIARKNAVLVER